MTGGFDLDDLDQMFFAECEDYLHSAESLLARYDSTGEDEEALDVLKRCAHSIKGASLTLGFTGLGALASALEQCLANFEKGCATANASIVREGFDAVRSSLAALRDGGPKSLGGPPDLLARLALQGAVDDPAPRTLVFRLSATGAATSVLFDDALDLLRARGRLSVLQTPWGTPGRECRLELYSTLADRAVIEIIERVAEPGSIIIEAGGADIPPAEAASPPTTSSVESLRTNRVSACVAFSVGSRRFAADAPGIEEIRSGDTVYPPPSASAWVCGTIELDGVFVPVVDLQHCLKLGNGSIRPSSMQLVSRVAGEAVAVLVDDVEEVLRLDDAAVQPLAAVIGRALPVGVRGVLKRNGEALWVLDLPQLLEAWIEAGDAL